ncbi:MAG: DUF1588 domain-containing protein [Pseudomonadales bacterium]|nr:DUF1588 domain-containing protein [Pseudomonadales bacterium]
MKHLIFLLYILSHASTVSAIIVASTLPASRSVQTGDIAAIFATVINGASSLASNCRIELATAIDADIFYQRTDPLTNASLGDRNVPVDIEAGQAQSFIVGLSANSAISSTDVNFSFICDNDGPAPVTSGLNTLIFSVNVDPVADVIALAATELNNGIVDLPLDNAFGFFAVATINLGSGAAISVTTEATGSPVSNALVCQTDPITAVCISDLLPTINVQIQAGSTPTFSIFLSSENAVNFDPANNRIAVTFSENGIIRGSTSVAIRGGGPSSTPSAADYFAANISNDIVQTTCIVCHRTGGVSGNTNLVFTSAATDSEHAAINLGVFETYVAAFGATRILDKVRGVAHGGGTQLASGSAGFVQLTEFLDLVSTTEIETPVSSAALFDNIILEENDATLQRAAIILSGFSPARALAAAKAANAEQQQPDELLRKALRGLMQGEGFHAFLIAAANDQLLTDKFLTENIFDTFDAKFVNYTNQVHDLRLEAEMTDDFQPLHRWQTRHSYGLARAPLELIAYVVNNELPYTEVLTADYMMANPWTNSTIGGTANFNDITDVSEFQPAKIQAYYRDDDSKLVDFERDAGPYILDPGNLITQYPHAGILNTPAFLRRYPSTATNRNRARARWTFQHFLGLDIEKSATRTTDPLALADTNNPTLNNDNCTVCHRVMDPVAGAFQNYGDTGLYREQYLGLDSLPNVYKFPAENNQRIYQQGDVWYRDMKAPGLGEDLAPDAANSLQWLAGQIIADPGFATATVEFWWPAIMGTRVILSPEESSDAGFSEQLLAYENQQKLIQTLAIGFIDGTPENGPFNLKDLFVEMLMSNWFRAESHTQAPTASLAISLQDVGIGRLLTPEQLARKTTALTGITWGNYFDPQLQTTFSHLQDRYKLYYGGINSAGITNRAEDMTTLMSAVAQSHALETACPIILHEFLLTDDDRLLFQGIDRNLSPASETSQNFEVLGANREQRKRYEINTNLQPGNKRVRISFLNDFFDAETQADRNLLVETLIIRDSLNNQLGLFELKDINLIAGAESQCGGAGTDHFNIWSNCSISIPFAVERPDTITVEVIAWGTQEGDESVQMRVELETGTPSDGLSNGSLAIKRQLISLHNKLLGEQLQLDSEELDRSFQLLVDTWQAKQNADLSNNFPGNHPCNTWQDYHFYDAFLATPHLINEHGYAEFDNDAIQAFMRTQDNSDARHMLKTWVVMMVYFMTDYRYLYI